MLRYDIMVTVFKKNEETNTRELDFPYDEVFANGLASEINLLINGQILTDGVDVYQLSVSRIMPEI